MHAASRVMFAACLTYSSNLKMEAEFSSEMSVNFYRTAWGHIPENATLRNHRSETLKSHLNLRPFPEARDHVSHEYKIAGKVVVLLYKISGTWVKIC
jgi:hypothetical protein